MPLDTSIPLQVALPRFDLPDPAAAADRQYNALRAQALQQEMMRNQLIMQNTMEDRARAEQNRRAAAAQAAAAQRQKQEMLRVLQSGYRPAREVVMGPGTVQGSTPAGYDFSGVTNAMLQRGNIGAVEELSKLQQQLAGQQKAEAEVPGVRAESRKKGTEADIAEYNAAVARLVPLVRTVKNGQDAANFVNATYDDPVLGPKLERIIPRAQAVARAPAEYSADPLAWMQSQMLTGEELSRALSTVPAGRTETITGADGSMLLLDKTTGVARPITMAPAAGTAGAPAAAGAPVRAAPTTEAQIKLAQSKEALPGAIETAELTLKQLEEMVGSENLGTKSGVPAHPGFEDAVGATYKPFARLVPGTAAADFSARFDQIQGGAFLKAYETLKGTGQITEKEGEKATAAINRMSLAQSEAEFTRAAREFYGVVNSALTRAKTKMSGGTASAGAVDNKSIFDAADAILGGK